MPVTVVTSIKKVAQPANLFFTDQGRKMWGDLWYQWSNSFPQGRSVLTNKSGHYIQFDEPELVVKEFLNLLEKLENINKATKLGEGVYN